MKDYRLTIKVRNNRLLKAIEDAGGTPGAKWCNRNGLGYIRVNNLINMTSGPLDADGNLYADAAKLCEVLGKLPEDLWSNEQLYPLEKNFSEMEMSYEQVLSLAQNEEQYFLPDFSEFENEQAKRLISKALSTLTEREQQVISMRFEDDLNYDECGKRLGISGCRIKQIESKALRKLRHSARMGIYVDAAVDFVKISTKERSDLKKTAFECFGNL